MGYAMPAMRSWHHIKLFRAFCSYSA